MAGPLAGEVEAVLGGEPGHGRDIVGVLDDRHRRGALVGVEVPGHAGLVPVGVIGVAIVPSIDSAVKSVNSIPPWSAECQTIHCVAPPDQQVSDHSRWKEAVGGDAGVGLEPGRERAGSPTSPR